VGAWIGKLIGVSITFSYVPSSVINSNEYSFPVSYGPVGAFKMIFPDYLDSEQNQYVLEVTKSREGIKSDRYYSEAVFTFNYGYEGSTNLGSAMTYTIGEYQ